MKSRWRNLGMVCFASAGALTAALWIFSRAHAEEPSATPSVEQEKKPVALVTTAPIRFGEIKQTIIAYGSVTAQPGEVAIYSMPIECRVRHVRASSGQHVEKGTPLIEVEPSPDARVQLIEARNSLEAAKSELALMRQRFELKLATNTERGQTEQALRSAQLKLDALQQRGGADEQHVITAQGPGLLSKVDVQEGQVVPAGASLVQSIAHDRIEIRLGVEPSEVRRLRVDQAVRIFPAGGDADEAVVGKVRMITQRVSPETRLVDVFVTPLPQEDPVTRPTTAGTAATAPSADQPPSLLLEAFVRGELVTETTQALIVPREAVLPDDDGFSLYTVLAGKAVKHTVKTGLSNAREVQVIAPGLQAGDAVVLLGNLELEDGMAVSPSAAPTAAGITP